MIYPTIAFPYSSEQTAFRHKKTSVTMIDKGDQSICNRGPLTKQASAAPYSPTGKPCSTIGAGGLNFRVRDGIGCTPTAMATEKIDHATTHLLQHNTFSLIFLEMLNHRAY